MTLKVPFADTLLPSDSDLLHRLGRAADRRGVTLWMVGGAVRDALRGERVLDIDLTSEAPADELGPLLVKEAGGSVASRSQFGTVKLRFDGRTMDLATARSERYARPGALPKVSPGTIEEDLARRDFSINAMAASLAPDTFGEILDTQGGIQDLDNQRVRALHDRSFQDDATRMLRAMRYASRLAFRLDRRTSAWLRRDLGYMDAISAARLRRELERMLDEERPVQALLEAHRVGVLGAVHPALGAPVLRATLRRAARRNLTPLALLGALVYASPAGQIPGLCGRLGLTSAQRSVVEHVARLRQAEPEIAGASASGVDALAGSAPEAAVEACAAVSADPRVRSRLSGHLEKVRTWRPPLNGHDLIALGVPPGPEVGRLLRLLRAAALDGRIRTRRSALTLVGKLLQEQER